MFMMAFYDSPVCGRCTMSCTKKNTQKKQKKHDCMLLLSGHVALYFLDCIMRLEQNASFSHAPIIRTHVGTTCYSLSQFTSCMKGDILLVEIRHRNNLIIIIETKQHALQFPCGTHGRIA